MSASPARLLTMTYDRLLVDLNRAEAHQRAEEWSNAQAQLHHAQACIAELRSSLRLGEWDGAAELMGIYDYTSRALTNAVIMRNPALIHECIDLLTPLAETWHRVAAMPGEI